MGFDPFNADPFGPDTVASDATQLQKDILRTFDRNPDMDAKAIARACDCSPSYVRETLKEYRPNDYGGGSGGLLGGGGGGLF